MYNIIPLNFNFETKLSPSNCYLIKTDQGFILIDTSGCNIYNLNIEPIRQSLQKQFGDAGCTSANLKLVLLTGGGIDFAGNCAYMQSQYQAKIAIHMNDSKAVENPRIPDTKGKPVFIRIMMFLMRSKLKQMYASFESFTPDLYLDESFNLLDYGLDAKILHIPGHSKGAIAVLTQEGDLFPGDTISNRNGKPKITPIAADKHELMTSISKLKKLRIKTVYPGYGDPFPMELLFDENI